MNISDNLKNEVFSDVSNITIVRSEHSIIWNNVRVRTNLTLIENIWLPVIYSHKRNKKNIQDNLNNAYNVLDSL
jgi:hypothetical protein